MKKLACIIIVSVMLFAFAVSSSAERVPDIYPDITGIEQTEDGVTVTVTIFNRKDEAIDGFALYDFTHASGIRLGGVTYNIGKWLNVTVKPHTAKRVKIKLRDARTDGTVKYRLYFSCWCGRAYVYGRVSSA